MVHTTYKALVGVNNFTVILQIGSNDISNRETSVDSVALAIRRNYFNTCTHSSCRSVFS
jgi:hypothetical protein